MKKKKQQFIEPQLSVSELSHALYEANQKLAKVNNDLIATQHERDIIFANISHDLRSPITAIRNTIELLRTSDDLSREEFNRLLDLMDARSDYLEHLINDVFLLSSLEVNQKINMSPENIGMFLEEFFFTAEADNKYKDRNLQLEVPEDFPYLVKIDPNLFLRVLDNLFSNALKYSEENATITLGASYADSIVTIWVKDTGIGMSEEHLPHIFDRTYRIDQARTPGAKSGCGLGLSIVKNIIDKHHGTIRCTSKLTEGSCFFIDLPVFKERK